VSVDELFSEDVEVLEVRLVRPQLLLPAVVLDGSLLELLEGRHLLVELLEHLGHLGVLVEILRQDALLVEGVDLFAELGDQGFELPLKALGLELLLGLDLGDDLGEARDLLLGVFDRIRVLLLDRRLAVVAEDAEELAVEVDLVSLGLELLVDSVPVLKLLHEVRDVVHWSHQV
jgi:hypothetical protein